MPMTAGEIKAALNRHHLHRKFSENPLALMLTNEAPNFFVEFPEWLPRKCSASAICELHIAMLLHCRDNRAMLLTACDNSERLAELFRYSASQSPEMLAAVTLGANSGIDKVLNGQTIQELDQKICEYRNLSTAEESALFAERYACKRVLEWLASGQLTFQRALERSPLLLFIAWY